MSSRWHAWTRCRTPRVGAVLVGLAIPAATWPRRAACARRRRHPTLSPAARTVDGRRGPPGDRAQPSARVAAPERGHLQGRRSDGGAEAEPGLFVGEREFSGVFAEPADAGQRRQQSELRRVGHLSLRARRQAGKAHAGRPRHHQRRVEVGGRRRASARVSDRAGVHQRAAGEVDARSRARRPEEFLRRGGTEPSAHERGRSRRGRLRQDLAAEAAVRAGRRVRAKVECASRRPRPALRLNLGFEAVTEDFDVDGDLWRTRNIRSRSRS